MDIEQKKTAIHEAGHAVARERYMIGQSGTSIIPNHEEGHLGFSSGNHLTPHEEDIGKENLTVYLAGYAAMVVAGYSEEDACSGAGSDFEKAIDEIRFISGGNLDYWKKQTVSFMSEPANAHAVTALAEVLIDNLTLNGDEVSIVIEAADEGDNPKQVLDTVRKARSHKPLTHDDILILQGKKTGDCQLENYARKPRRHPES